MAQTEKDFFGKQQAAVGSAGRAVEQDRQNRCGQGRQAGTKQGGLQGDNASRARTGAKRG